MQPPVITVVVCTRNRGESVEQTARSLLKSEYAHFEVIVVDQSDNEDASGRIARLQDPRLRYIRAEPRGKGWACNTGLREARGELVAFTDDDCTVPADWLATMEQALRSQPQVALVFCSVVAAEYDMRQGYIPAFEVKANRVVKTIDGLRDGIGMGAGVIMRRDAVRALGGFDNSLGPGSRFRSAEDHDIAIRVLLKGHWIGLSADTHVIHYGFRSWNEGRTHASRDLFAAGAAYVKPVKCGHMAAFRVLLLGTVVENIMWPLRNIVAMQRPFGFMRLVFFMQGVVSGLMASVDREKILYKGV